MIYKPQLPPRPYQLEALAKAKGKPAFAWLMAMRTGKTLVDLTEFGQMELSGLVHDELMIAPAGVYKTWLGAIQECLSKDLLSRLSVGVWESSAGAKGRRAFDKFLATATGPRILLMNVEALSNVQGARDACEQFVNSGKRLSKITVDESTIIKGPKAERAKYVVNELGSLANYRRILSGLPTPRSPLDLYMQFNFLDPAILRYNNYYAFQAHYAIVVKKYFGGNRPVKVVVGYRNQEELQQRIAPYVFRVPFRPNIPPTYSIREVTMTKEQRRIYDDLREFATAEICKEKFVTATIVLAQMTRLHQVLCGHTVDDQTGEVIRVPENRTKELLKLVDDYAGKAIIWCTYDIDVRKVAEALAKEYDPDYATNDAKWPNKYVARFWGGNMKTRESEERAFKTTPECRFMVATASAGGKGRTWDMADLNIYYSCTNNLEHRDQSEQRGQNVGKVKGVDHVDLIVRGTVEEKFLGAIRKKIDMSTLMMGDAWREWVV